MPNIERLEQLYPFDADVLGCVSDAAAWQNQYTFAQLAAHYQISDGPEIVPADDGHKAFEVLTIVPSVDYDPEEARVYHLPMALPVDPSMTMRGLRLFEADPSKQLIMAGNPSAAGQRYGKLRLEDMRRVWLGDLLPVVDPLLAHLNRRGVRRTEELGFSYGADTAAVSSARAEDHDISVDRSVYMESAAVLDRGPGLIGLAKLGLDFISAGDELENYVAACESPPLNEARELSDVGLPRYLLGLARLSNLAIENALAHSGFEERARAALATQDKMHATMVWGTASELTTNSSMLASTARLRKAFGEDRVGSMAIEGMHHAGGDDIDLHAAIVLQALTSS